LLSPNDLEEATMDDHGKETEETIKGDRGQFALCTSMRDDDDFSAQQEQQKEVDYQEFRRNLRVDARRRLLRVLTLWGLRKRLCTMRTGRKEQNPRNLLPRIDNSVEEVDRRAEDDVRTPLPAVMTSNGRNQKLGLLISLGKFRSILRSKLTRKKRRVVAEGRPESLDEAENDDLSANSADHVLNEEQVEENWLYFVFPFLNPGLWDENEPECDDGASHFSVSLK